MPLTHHLLLHPAKNPGVPHLHQDAAQSHIALSPDHRPRHPEPTFSKPPAPEQWLQRPRAVPDPLPVSLNIWYVDMAHRLISSVLLPQMRVSNPVTLCPHPILLAQRPASLPELRLPAATLAPKASSKRSHLVTPVTSCPSSPKPPAPGSHQREDSIVHPARPFSRIYLGNFPVWVLSLGQDLRPHISPLSASSLSHITTGSSQKRPSLVACACPTLGAMLPLSVHGSPAAPAQPWRGGGRDSWGSASGHSSSLSQASASILATGSQPPTYSSSLCSAQPFQHHSPCHRLCSLCPHPKGEVQGPDHGLQASDS